MRLQDCSFHAGLEILEVLRLGEEKEDMRGNGRTNEQILLLLRLLEENVR